MTASKPSKEFIVTISHAPLEEIANFKFPYLTSADIDAAVRIIAGTARSLDITLEEV
ncbi:hypothetical protein IDZ49_10155 [Francisella tularensis]|nr:hypothetical protein [Francisella tularensis]